MGDQGHPRTLNAYACALRMQHDVELELAIACMRMRIGLELQHARMQYLRFSRSVHVIMQILRMHATYNHNQRAQFKSTRYRL